MKSKTFRKKLTLNKKTIADLSIGKMKNVNGGAGLPTVIETEQSICYPNITGCCPSKTTCDPICICP